jgi:hypothetical protein
MAFLLSQLLSSKHLTNIMKRNIILKILLWLIALTFALLVILKLAVEPWAEKKLRTTLNENFTDFTFAINNVDISIFQAGITINGIALSSKPDPQINRTIDGRIGTISIKGINPFLALFKKEISISEVTLRDCSIAGKIPFPDKDKPPTISGSDIRVGLLQFDGINIGIGNTLDAQFYEVKEGSFSLRDLQLKKYDTLSARIVKKLDFKADELVAVSPDSMYTYKAAGVSCSTDEKMLAVNRLVIEPSYKDYEFTSRHQFEIDRFEAVINHIYFHDFDIAGFANYKILESSYIEIGQVDLDVFRDKRETFRHFDKAAFQDVIYNYPGKLNIDSISILGGEIIYTEHAEGANEAGWISFQKINAQIYKISNDTRYKTETGWMELKANAMIMGEGKLDVFLKAKLYDRQNTFSLFGTLYQMKGSALNPIVEKNAFVYITSGKIEKMSFSLTADNTKSTGTMNLLYQGLDLTVKNKQTDDTTAIKSRIKSFFANLIVVDSNPMPGEEVRVGVIDFERNPEKFIFNYWAKSILSGIKTSIVKSPVKENI